jgi:Ca-activated chloride channel family protein
MQQVLRPMKTSLWTAAIAVLLTSGIVTASENVSKEKEKKDGPKLTLNSKPAFSVLKSGEKQTTWIRVGLKGFHLTSEAERAPLNVAIVLDRSGSMQGEKLQRAREAAVNALEVLKPTDIVSVIAYDTDVSVLVPATRLTDREQVASVIRGIQAQGNTALFGGVSKGAAEVRKFLDNRHVNRIILLSDGLANVGPSSPGELGALGASLKKENISVSTLGLGLGYNEDLMVALAGQSGGNHQFIENASELASVFRREFDEVLSAVAQEVDIKVQIPEGIRPVRVLGNSSDINGQSIVSRLSQVYSDQHKHIVIEVEIPAELAATPAEGQVAALKLASVEVTYANLSNHQSESLAGEIAVTFSTSDDAVKASRDNTVMADVVALVASEQNKYATQLLDQGDLVRCREVLMGNSAYLRENAVELKVDSLNYFAEINEMQSKKLEDAKSNMAPSAVATRKSFRALQNQVDQQAPAIAQPKNE